MKVLALPEVQQYLDDLSHILYEKDYFGFLDSSEEYIEDLLEDIKTTLPHRPRRDAPRLFRPIREGYVLRYLQEEQAHAVVCLLQYIRRRRGARLSCPLH